MSYKKVETDTKKTNFNKQTKDKKGSTQTILFELSFDLFF